MARTAERLMKIYKEGIIPKTYQDFQLALSGYATGKIEAITAISRLKAVLDTEILYWGQYIEREKAIARLEAIAGNTDSSIGGKREMKKPIIIVVCLVLVAAGIVFFYSTRKSGNIDNPPKNVAQAVAGQQTGSMPGMPGMPAEKPAGEPAKPTEETEKQEEAPTVEIPLEKQQLIGVKTIAASVQPLQKIIRTVGKIEYDERKLTTVNTKVEGWIEKLYVNFTGIYVKKGEPLADIYSPELWATQQEFINVVRWAKKTGKGAADRGKTADSSGDTQNLAAMLSKDAESIVDAARQRLKLWDISDEQIKKIEDSEKPIRTLTIYSPVSGYVLQKYATQGMKVMAGEKLLDVSDLSIVWVVADIYEYELPFIKVGDTARIQTELFPGQGANLKN